MKALVIISHDKHALHVWKHNYKHKQTLWSDKEISKKQSFVRINIWFVKLHHATETCNFYNVLISVILV